MLPAALAAGDGIPAFPGAEGFGAAARGGRGGRVLFVSRLDDYDPKKQAAIPGTLRAACAAKGPRIVIFRTGGTIDLEAPLNIAEPFITIAGQSAPGGGICIRNFETVIRTSQVIVRHIRFRPGDVVPRRRGLKRAEKRGKWREGTSFENDAVSVNHYGRPGQIRDIILDHCSASWSTDECLSVVGGGTTGVTVQWCIISESLHRSFHFKVAHGLGSLIKCNGDVSFHHNLYAHHVARGPHVATYGEGSILLDFRNNVIYDTVGHSQHNIPARLNYVGNYIKRPRRMLQAMGEGRHAFIASSDRLRMFVEGNFLEGAGDRNCDDWQLIGRAAAHHKRAEPFDVATVATTGAREAYDQLLASAGAILPKRDAVDERIVAQVRAGTGGQIDSQDEVGGWPALDAGSAPTDGDRDGMPDEWEAAHGLDADDPNDASADGDGDGYTNIEEWLNGTPPVGNGKPKSEGQKRD